MLDRLRDQIAVWKEWAAGKPSYIEARYYHPPLEKSPYRFGKESIMRHASVKPFADASAVPFRAQVYIEECAPVEGDPHCDVNVRLDHMLAGRTGTMLVGSYKFTAARTQGWDLDEARVEAEKFIARWNEDPAFAAGLMSRIMPSIPQADWALPPPRAARQALNHGK